MFKKTPVPRLDLAPKLKRPLSLWNPLDYLRLLYWVLYFPQALRWYVDTFGTEFFVQRVINWKLLKHHTVEHNLLLQVLVLTVVTPLALSLIIQKTGIPINWSGVALGLALGIFWGMVLGGLDSVLACLACILAGSVVGSVTGGVSFGISIHTSLFWYIKEPSTLIFLSLSFSAAAGVTGSIISNIIGLCGREIEINVTKILREGTVKYLEMSASYGSILGAVSNFTVYVVFVLSWMIWMIVNEEVRSAPDFFFLLFMMVFYYSFFVVACGGYVGYFAGFLLYFRPDSWLIALPLNIPYLQKGSLPFLRVTPLPLPCLSIRLKIWLQHDWEKGLHNANQLLVYTLQFTPVVKAVNQVLAKTAPEQIIWHVSKLVENSFDWEFVLSNSTNFSEILKYPKTKTPRLETSARATVAGFWYLYEKEPVKAEEAFAMVRPLLHGEEMYTLSHNLAIFHEARWHIDKIASIPVEKLHVTSLQSSQQSLLRPTTWKVISSLHHIVQDIRLVKRGVSIKTRAFALNRAQGELTNILNNCKILPQAERRLIVDITETWQRALLPIAHEIAKITTKKPVPNPYIIGDPVVDGFVGREDVMRQLEELWVTGEQLQSVVIYGHRRMGKTSILRNVVNSVGSGVKVAYVNMLNASNISEGVGEVLMAICDAVSEVVNLPPPDEDKLLQIPYRTFERYLKQIVETPQRLNADAAGSGASLQGLIIALDEFEKIEELIAAGEIPQDFMGYLRGLVQMNSQLAFAFAGLHTLEEMTADYFQPFFASVIPIHVGFMERAATKQILANPVQLLDVETRHQSSDTEKTYHGTSLQEDCPLDYRTEALDKIYDLTHGQPYLVQLIGFQLVRRYNDQVFEMGRKRDPIFTVEEVEAVINDPQFFKRGRYYFDGVWSQAAQGADGQQMILQILAPHAEGLSCKDITFNDTTRNIDDESLQAALNTLKRHDVIQETEGRWYIIVELFRRWVLRTQGTQ